MILVRLVGGLGNQLFQYAFARSISVDKRVEVKLDAISGFENDCFYRRSYSLDHFNISLQPTSRQEVTAALDSGSGGRTGAPYTIVREKGFSLNDLGSVDWDENLYFIGYWQTEKYFRSIEGILREELQVNAPLRGKSTEYARIMEGTDSVSIHIRALHGISPNGRKSDRDIALHGRIPIDYYRDALAYLSNACGTKLTHFVFSDDIESAGKVMNDLGISCHFVSHDGPEKDYEDFRLMSLCRHHILANSTFSWWGAWLCNDARKTVIAPKDWFSDPSPDTTNLIPESWVRV